MSRVNMGVGYDYPIAMTAMGTDWAGRGSEDIRIPDWLRTGNIPSDEDKGATRVERSPVLQAYASRWFSPVKEESRPRWLVQPDFLAGTRAVMVSQAVSRWQIKWGPLRAKDSFGNWYMIAYGFLYRILHGGMTRMKEDQWAQFQAMVQDQPESMWGIYHLALGGDPGGMTEAQALDEDLLSGNIGAGHPYWPAACWIMSKWAEQDPMWFLCVLIDSLFGGDVWPGVPDPSPDADGSLGKLSLNNILVYNELNKDMLGLMLHRLVVSGFIPPGDPNEEKGWLEYMNDYLDAYQSRPQDAVVVTVSVLYQVLSWVFSTEVTGLNQSSYKWEEGVPGWLKDVRTWCSDLMAELSVFAVRDQGEMPGEDDPVQSFSELNLGVAHMGESFTNRMEIVGQARNGMIAYMLREIDHQGKVYRRGIPGEGPAWYPAPIVGLFLPNDNVVVPTEAPSLAMPIIPMWGSWSGVEPGPLDTVRFNRRALWMVMLQFMEAELEAGLKPVQAPWMVAPKILLPDQDGINQWNGATVTWYRVRNAGYYRSLPDPMDLARSAWLKYLYYTRNWGLVEADRIMYGATLAVPGRHHIPHHSFVPMRMEGKIPSVTDTETASFMSTMTNFADMTKVTVQMEGDITGPRAGGFDYAIWAKDGAAAKDGFGVQMATPAPLFMDGLSNKELVPLPVVLAEIGSDGELGHVDWGESNDEDGLVPTGEIAHTEAQGVAEEQEQDNEVLGGLTVVSPSELVAVNGDAGHGAVNYDLLQGGPTGTGVGVYWRYDDKAYEFATEVRPTRLILPARSVAGSGNEFLALVPVARKDTDMISVLSSYRSIVDSQPGSRPTDMWSITGSLGSGNTTAEARLARDAYWGQNGVLAILDRLPAPPADALKDLDRTALSDSYSDSSRSSRMTVQTIAGSVPAPFYLDLSVSGGVPDNGEAFLEMINAITDPTYASIGLQTDEDDPTITEEALASANRFADELLRVITETKSVGVMTFNPETASFGTSMSRESMDTQPVSTNLNGSTGGGDDDDAPPPPPPPPPSPPPVASGTYGSEGRRQVEALPGPPDHDLVSANSGWRDGVENHLNLVLNAPPAPDHDLQSLRTTFSEYSDTSRGLRDELTLLFDDDDDDDNNDDDDDAISNANGSVMPSGSSGSSDVPSAGFPAQSVGRVSQGNSDAVSLFAPSEASSAMEEAQGSVGGRSDASFVTAPAPPTEYVANQFRNARRAVADATGMDPRHVRIRHRGERDAGLTAGAAGGLPTRTVQRIIQEQGCDLPTDTMAEQLSAIPPAGRNRYRNSNYYQALALSTTPVPKFHIGKGPATTYDRKLKAMRFQYKAGPKPGSRAAGHARLRMKAWNAARGFSKSGCPVGGPEWQAVRAEFLKYYPKCGEQLEYFTRTLPEMGADAPPPPGQSKWSEDRKRAAHVQRQIARVARMAGRVLTPEEREEVGRVVYGRQRRR